MMHQFFSQKCTNLSIEKHLCYADDLCIITLSSSGMQQLLNICQSYAIKQQLLYNGSKSFMF